MKYKVERASMRNDLCPVEEAFAGEYGHIDVRTFPSFEEYDRKFRDNFKDIGCNHCINKDGKIQRTITREGWFIEINNLEELHEFIKKYGDIVIQDNRFLTVPEIIIYDDYLE